MMPPLSVLLNADLEPIFSESGFFQHWGLKTHVEHSLYLLSSWDGELCDYFWFIVRLIRSRRCHVFASKRESTMYGDTHQ